MIGLRLITKVKRGISHLRTFARGGGDIFSAFMMHHFQILGVLFC